MLKDDVGSISRMRVMKVSMDNFKIGMRLEGRRVSEIEATQKANETDVVQQISQENMPIGLKVPRIIPTGSIFVPKELIAPPQKPLPKVDEEEPVLNTELLPDKVDTLQSDNKEVSNGSSEISIQGPHQTPPSSTLDILV